MKRRITKFDDYVGIPVEKPLKQQIARIAKAEERNMTDMARMLLKEAVEARAKLSKSEAAEPALSAH